MAVRTAYVGTQVSGDVLTAANFSKLPGGWIGDAQITSNQGSITTEVDVTGSSLTVTVGTNRKLRLKGFALVSSTINADEIVIKIKEGSTQLTQDGTSIATQPRAQGLHPEVIITPTAGSHTYKMTILRNNGTGTVTLSASGSFPAFLIVEDIGPSS